MPPRRLRRWSWCGRTPTTATTAARTGAAAGAELLARRLGALDEQAVGVLDARISLHHFLADALHALLELGLVGAADADQLGAALLPRRLGLAVLLGGVLIERGL